MLSNFPLSFPSLHHFYYSKFNSKYILFSFLCSKGKKLKKNLPRCYISSIIFTIIIRKGIVKSFHENISLISIIKHENPAKGNQRSKGRVVHPPFGEETVGWALQRWTACRGRKKKRKCSRAFLSVIYMAIPARRTRHPSIIVLTTESY